jgi:vacuolar-type H+-ATPase subunit I/STV1
MSNIISIDELRKLSEQHLTVQEWQDFAERQTKLLEQYDKKVRFLEEKNKNLESMLMSRSAESLISTLTPEENICIQQIDRLEKLSNERQLTLEEVKRLDLLVKNLKLIREESTIVVNSQKSDNLKEEDLVAIIRAERE